MEALTPEHAGFDSLVCPTCHWVHDPDDVEACQALVIPDAERVVDAEDHYQEDF